MCNSAPCSLSFLPTLCLLTKHRTQPASHRKGRELYVDLIKSFDDNLIIIIGWETLNLISTHNVFNGDRLHLKRDGVMLCSSTHVWKWGCPWAFQHRTTIMVTSFLPRSLPVIALFSKHQFGRPSHWLTLLNFQIMVSSAPVPGFLWLPWNF